MVEQIPVTAPEREPERQIFFIEKCKKWVQEEETKLQRDLTVSIQTMGCQMNARDSEKLLAIFEMMGYKPTEDAVADFVLYNTCTVRENANQKLYGRLGYLKRQKSQNSHMKIGICGCMMQEPTAVEKIRTSYPFVDLVFGTHNVYQLAEIFYHQLLNDVLYVDVWDKPGEVVEDHLPSVRKYPFKGSVNIAYGCDKFCTFCIVPHVRGRERSREPEEILKEVKDLVKSGAKEVMLLGQNVNSYGKTLKTPITFAKLLEMVEQVDGLERIRFMTPHPKDITDEMIDVMAKSKKICNQLHFPLQSGSDRLLKKMNRHYTKKQYMDWVDKIKEKIPDVALTTDIIVGFPGETEEDFLETMDVIRKARYASVYSFIYSKRTGTPAAKMPDQVPEDIIKDRFDRMLAEIHKISAEIHKAGVGKVEEVLFEEINAQDSTMITGRLTNNDLVHCKGDASLIGKILPVKLTESMGFYYIGELVK